MTAVSFAEANSVGRLTLSSPPVNAMNHAFMRELEAAIEEAREADVAVLVVESDLDGMFSAGGDLSWYVETDEGTLRNFVASIHKTFRTLEQLPAVTIAAIDGHCLAGGFELALACDLRIASAGDWMFGCTETEIGAIPGGGGTQRLPREVGRATAIDMIANARRVSPSEADDLGLIQRLVEPDDFEAAVTSYAERLASGPGRAIAATKLAVTNGMDMGLDEGLAYEQQLEYDLFGTADFEEGLDAFANDREPDFRGE